MQIKTLGPQLILAFYQLILVGATLKKHVGKYLIPLAL